MSAKDFILSLDEKLRAKTLWNINLLAKVGTALRGPESSKLDDGIFEIRTIVGTNLTRVLYFFCIGKKAVLTNGFVKKTQKTPKKEIEKALQGINEELTVEEIIKLGLKNLAR